MTARHAPRGRLKQRDPIRDKDPKRVGANGCRATTRSGKPCAGQAIAGGHVCRMHGGGAPQVKAKAIERLMALQHPALDRIAKLIAQDEYPSVAYSASKDVLDRTIGRAVEHVELTHHAADEILARLAGARDRTK